GSGRVMFEEGKARLVAPNITPDVETGAGNWTDDQFARAIREGIGHDGRALFPLMPYDDFRHGCVNKHSRHFARRLPVSRNYGSSSKVFIRNLHRRPPL